MYFQEQAHILPIDERINNQILNPGIDFFMRTQKIKIDSVPNFTGVGVYAIFFDDPLNTIYGNSINNNYPIYVGKAVPSGTRQGGHGVISNQLCRRISEHRRSMHQGGMDTSNVSIRFMIMTGIAVDLIPAMESAIIRFFRPLWNSYIDGFGIHTPGAGRYNQQPSEWDTLHPGRPWLEKLTGKKRDYDTILRKISEYKMRDT